MTEAIGEAVLRNGDTLRILKVTAPDRQWVPGILQLLSGKGAMWRSNIRVALESGLGQLGVHFYLGVIGPRPVGNVTVHRAPAPDTVGMIVHVFTHPSYRRLGIASALTRAALGDFQRHGGELLYLNAQYQSPAFELYRQSGLEPISSGGDMLWAAPGAREETRFGAGVATVRELAWQHWPGLHALYLIEAEAHLRSLHFYQWGRCGYEGEFPLLMDNIASGRVRDARVLVSHAGVVVGHAYLAGDVAWPPSGLGYLRHLKRVWYKLRSAGGDPGKLRSLPHLMRAYRLIRAHRAHAPLLEFFVHPNFGSQALELLGCLDVGERALCAVADSEARERSSTLEAAGMKRIVRLPQMVPRGEELLDIDVFGS